MWPTCAFVNTRCDDSNLELSGAIEDLLQILKPVSNYSRSFLLFLFLISILSFNQMYLRFTTQFINPYGELEIGIFMALKYLRDDHSLTKDEDIDQLKELSGWFNRNLEKPTRFSKGTSKFNADVSLSWFKDSAKEHIQKIQNLIEIAERYDIIIERIASRNPGYIIFEDKFQVSAVPFKTDRKRVM